MNTNKKICRFAQIIFFVFPMFFLQNSFGENPMKETILKTTDAEKVEQQTLVFEKSGDQVIVVENNLANEPTTQHELALFSGAVTGTVYTMTLLKAGENLANVYVLAPVLVGAELVGLEKLEEWIGYKGKFYSDTILKSIALHGMVAIISCCHAQTAAVGSSYRYLLCMVWCVPSRTITGVAGTLTAKYIVKNENIIKDITNYLSIGNTAAFVEAAIVREAFRVLLGIRNMPELLTNVVQDGEIGVVIDAIKIIFFDSVPVADLKTYPECDEL